MIVQTITFFCQYPGCKRKEVCEAAVCSGGKLITPNLPCGWQAVQGPGMNAHYCFEHTYRPELSEVK